MSSPVDIYEKVYGTTPYSFLYESLESVGKRGRYSIVGGNPFLIFKSKNEMTEVTFLGSTVLSEDNPIDLLNKLIKQFITKKGLKFYKIPN